MKKIELTARSVELTEKKFRELNPGKNLPVWAEEVIEATIISTENVVTETVITISDGYSFEGRKTFEGELNLGEPSDEVRLLSCVGKLKPWKEDGTRKIVLESGWVDISPML